MNGDWIGQGLDCCLSCCLATRIYKDVRTNREYGQWRYRQSAKAGNELHGDVVLWMVYGVLAGNLQKKRSTSHLGSTCWRRFYGGLNHVFPGSSYSVLQAVVAVTERAPFFLRRLAG